jgi:hypothetical protein
MSVGPREIGKATHSYLFPTKLSSNSFLSKDSCLMTSLEARMPWRPKIPSPTWRTFLHNHLPDIAAIDMFVVATATFQLLYILIVLSLDRRCSL